MQLNQTLLKCGISENYLSEICMQAIKKQLSSVSVFPSLVKAAKTNLIGSGVHVCSTISFPLGADAPEVKIQECKNAISDGADEVSLVMNAAAVKAGMLDIVREEVGGVVQAAHKTGCVVKVMVEMTLLTNEQAARAAQIADEAGADVIQTATGFKPLQKREITKEDVALVLANVKNAKVEAVGTFNDMNSVVEMLSAGASLVASDVAVVL